MRFTYPQLHVLCSIVFDIHKTAATSLSKTLEGDDNLGMHRRDSSEELSGDAVAYVVRMEGYGGRERETNSRMNG